MPIDDDCEYEHFSVSISLSLYLGCDVQKTRKFVNSSNDVRIMCVLIAIRMKRKTCLATERDYNRQHTMSESHKNFFQKRGEKRR
jgi:hypothetical protein